MSHTTKRLSMRLVLAVGVAASAIAAATPATARSFDAPSALCLAHYRWHGHTYEATKWRVRPEHCSLRTGYRLNMDGLKFIDPSWGTWKHNRASGRIWIRHNWGGYQEKFVNGKRYGLVRVRLDKPARERNDSGWFYSRVMFKYPGGPWFAYSRGDGCDSFSPPDC